MKVLIAVKGLEDDEYFQRVGTLAPLTRADVILLVHVIDSVPRADLERARDRFLIRRPVSQDRAAELLTVEEEHAAAVLQSTRQALGALGLPDDRLRGITLRGKPNEELRRLAELEEVSLIVVRGRSEQPGPHSLGKTARFLIDHCREAALLVR